MGSFVKILNPFDLVGSLTILMLSCMVGFSLSFTIFSLSVFVRWSRGAQVKHFLQIEQRLPPCKVGDKKLSIIFLIDTNWLGPIFSSVSFKLSLIVLFLDLLKNISGKMAFLDIFLKEVIRQVCGVCTFLHDRD